MDRVGFLGDQRFDKLPFFGSTSVSLFDLPFFFLQRDEPDTGFNVAELGKLIWGLMQWLDIERLEDKQQNDSGKH